MLALSHQARLDGFLGFSIADAYVPCVLLPVRRKPSRVPGAVSDRGRRRAGVRARRGGGASAAGGRPARGRAQTAFGHGRPPTPPASTSKGFPPRENPARDRVHVRLPREEREEPNPPTAEQIAATLPLMPRQYALAVLVLDATGMRRDGKTMPTRSRQKSTPKLPPRSGSRRRSSARSRHLSTSRASCA